MAKAGVFAANAAARDGSLSYASAATIGERWGQFADWARAEEGIKWMEDVDRETVVAYGQELADRPPRARWPPARPRTTCRPSTL